MKPVIRIKELQSTDPIALKFTTEVIEGIGGDTRVTLPSGHTLCWIWSANINDFITEINDLLTKYRI